MRPSKSIARSLRRLARKIDPPQTDPSWNSLPITLTLTQLQEIRNPPPDLMRWVLRTKL